MLGYYASTDYNQSDSLGTEKERPGKKENAVIYYLLHIKTQLHFIRSSHLQRNGNLSRTLGNNSVTVTQVCSSCSEITQQIGNTPLQVLLSFTA